MSKKIRFLSLLLALLMVASVFVACGETEEPGVQTDGDATNGAAVTEQETDPVEDALTALRGECSLLTGEQTAFGYKLVYSHSETSLSYSYLFYHKTRIL